MGSIARCSLWWAVAVALCALLVAASPAWGAKAAAGAGQKADDDAIAATVDLSDLIDSLLLPRLAAPRGRQSATFKTRALLEAEAEGEGEEEAGIEEADEEEETEGGDEELLVDGEDTDDDTESLDEVDDNLQEDLNERDSSDPLGEGTTMNNGPGTEETLVDDSEVDYQPDTSSGRMPPSVTQEEASGIAEGVAAAVTDDEEETIYGPMVVVEEPMMIEDADPGDVVPPPAMEADNSMVGWGEQFDQLEEEAAAFSEDEDQEIEDALEEIADGLEDEDGPVDVVLAFNADAIGSGENGQDGLTAAMPDGEDGEDAVVAIAVNGNAEAVGGDGGNGRDGADGLDGSLSVDGDNIQSNGMDGEDGGNGGQGGQGGYALAIGVDVDAAAGGGDGGSGGDGGNGGAGGVDSANEGIARANGGNGGVGGFGGDGGDAGLEAVVETDEAVDIEEDDVEDQVLAWLQVISESLSNGIGNVHVGIGADADVADADAYFAALEAEGSDGGHGESNNVVILSEDEEDIATATSIAEAMEDADLLWQFIFFTFFNEDPELPPYMPADTDWSEPKDKKRKKGGGRGGDGGRGGTGGGGGSAFSFSNDAYAIGGKGGDGGLPGCGGDDGDEAGECYESLSYLDRFRARAAVSLDGDIEDQCSGDFWALGLFCAFLNSM
mmetsp:Transcript_11722/g.25014  ORF Transcript_11722/g.25014 Transcript_11722/m.25014 type:complete len:666 (+) Transcript_11722:183-2180(+)